MINRFRDLLLSDACFYSMDRCVVLFRQSFSQHITPEAKNRLTAYFLATELENELNRTSFYKANPALLYPAGVYSLKTIRDSLDNRTRDIQSIPGYFNVARELVTPSGQS